MNVRYLPAGDCALVVELGERIAIDVNERVRAIDHLLAARRVDGVVETVPSFRSLLVYYDPCRVGFESLIATIDALLGDASANVLPPPRVIELPCCYHDPVLGFELEAAARQLNLSTTELVARHARAEYLVYFLGFAPGQPYMTAVADPLEIARLQVPRTKTSAGSVGIGGSQCCIYSVESPGGFWVLGHTPVPLYDPASATPILLRPGDRIRFRSIDRDEHDRIAARVAARTYQPAIA